MARDRDSDDEPRRGRHDRDEDDDDRAIRRSRRSASADDGGVGYVIPYRNGAALAAYYIGIFGLFLCFCPGVSIFSGTTAVVFGFKGLSKAKQDPDAHGSAHAWVGIVLGFTQILAAPVSGTCGILGLMGKLG